MEKICEKVIFPSSGKSMAGGGMGVRNEEFLELQTSSLLQTQPSNNLSNWSSEDGNRSASLRNVNYVKIQKPSYPYFDMQSPELFCLR
jgi:hypothetical protein